MRIITTFNGVLYNATGRHLLASIAEHLPQAEVLVYEELDGVRSGAAEVAVCDLPEFQHVLAGNRDIIPKDMGGAAGNLQSWNRRWFGWFRKVVAQYDALVRRPHDGYTLLLDADARIVAPFDDATIARHLQRPVGVLKGDREAIEAGLIFYDGRVAESRRFVERFMELFLSGEFRRLKRWDDGYVMTHCMQQQLDSVQDFADGLEAIEHTNSNGHTTGGQILPRTVWGGYVEHDKGVHWRVGAAPNLHHAQPGGGFLRRALRRLRKGA